MDNILRDLVGGLVPARVVGLGLVIVGPELLCLKGG